MVVAAMLVVPMMWLKRMLMVTGPATYDTMTGAFGSFRFTWVAIAITLAATAAVPLLLMLLFRVVPLLSIDEIEEIDEMEELDRLEKTASASPRTEPVEATRQDERLTGATPTTHRVAGATGVLAVIALLSIVGVGAATHASAATPQPGAVILLNGREAAGAVQLNARLSDPRGVPIPNQPVTFGFSTRQFGPVDRLVALGTVTTDTKGVALFTVGGDAAHLYKPTSNGPQEFLATYGDVAQPVTGRTTVNVTVAQPAYHPAPPKPLAGVGNILVIVLFSIVAAIWLTLGAQVWRVRRACRGPRETAVGRA
jgi:hypothetical protein